MNTFRRVWLPVLVVVILLGALVFRLSSCTSDAAGNTQTAESPAKAPAAVTGMEASPPPGAKSPAPPYSGAEIRRIYESLGLSAVEIRDAGGVTMVHYHKPTGVPGEIISRFDWFDRSTGARELVYGPAYADRFEIKPDKSLTVLSAGKSYISGLPSFPSIYRAGYTDLDGALMFTGAEEKYYAPIDNSYSLGTDRHASLSAVSVNPGFISFGFSPQPGYESEFYSETASIPKMDIDIADGFATVTLHQTIPSEWSEILTVKENPYCGVESLISEGADTIITLRLSDSVTRYNVSTEYSPEDGYPYAVIEFTAAGFDYPAGW